MPMKSQKSQNPRKLVFVLLLLFTFNQPLWAGSTVNVEQAYKQLSLNDRFFLKHFFVRFLKYDGLGHVVFFDTKPGCFTDVSKYPHENYRRKNVLKGWNYWKQHKHLFPHPNFIFIEEEVVFGDEVILHIFLLNKKILASSIEANLGIFEKR